MEVGMIGTPRILVGDVLDRLRELPDESVQCVITSPPYWGLRDYGCEGQIGLEPTPDAFVDRLVGVFREVRRVLRSDGVCFVNLGDSYAGGGRGGKPDESEFRKQATNVGSLVAPSVIPSGLKPKDLVGIPWRVAFALQADGWWLRQDIIWSKPNPMPESVTDRCTKAHEYVFLFTKSARYFWDAEAVKEVGAYCGKQLGIGRGKKIRAEAMGRKPSGNEVPGSNAMSPARRNRRSVWHIPTHAYPEAHFATFPPALVEPCVKAGTSERGACPECGKPWERVVERTPMGKDLSGRRDALASFGRTACSGAMTSPPSSTTLGWRPTCDHSVFDVDPPSEPPFTPRPCVVLDPFSGSGTTGVVACGLGRDYIGIELNTEYAAMSERRIGEALRPSTYRDDKLVRDAPLFTQEATP